VYPSQFQCIDSTFFCSRYHDASRFWVKSKSDDEEEAGGSEEVASLRRRAITFAGKFEPVKWKCRAPLSSGKLCERMDRNKVGESFLFVCAVKFTVYNFLDL